jgi:membrane protease YdiL (CAAX protease family)
MDSAEILKHLALIGVGVFFTSLTLFFFFKKERFPKTELSGLKWPKNRSTALSDYLKGLSLFVFTYPSVFLTAQLIGFLTALLFPESKNQQIVISLLKNLRETPLIFFSLSLYLIFIVPFLEELLFRGFLQTTLRKITPLKLNIFLTSLVFAGFHYSALQGISNIELMSALFVLSCFLCYFQEKGSSIFIPIGVHSAFNLFNIVLVILTP